MRAKKANLRKVDTPVSHERVSVSFQYMTKDIDYRLERFKNDRREFLSSLLAFYNCLLQITALSWVEFSLRRKGAGGYESIPAQNLKPAVRCQSIEESGKYISCRFGDGDSFRIIGVKLHSDPTLYITGFDLDFSAYNHGS